EEDVMPKTRHSRQVLLAVAVLLALGVMVPGALTVATGAPPDRLSFDMVVSGGAKPCLPDAQGHVRVNNVGANQRLHLVVSGLPPTTGFTFFLLQVPTAPFAMAWYQGDIDTDEHGSGSQQFFGIFSSETFIFAPATRPAPQTHPGVDAASNPTTAPVHMYHLGLWFADAADAAAAGCPNTVTPVDGDHQAGIQVLNTSNFGLDAKDGPLGQLE